MIGFFKHGGPIAGHVSSSINSEGARSVATFKASAFKLGKKEEIGKRDAQVIEFHTHGIIGNDVTEPSYLVLSPELGRQYTLTAADVAQVALAGAPLVILGACHAAASSRSPEGGIGLAEAFLRSGARAVIASPDAIPDRAATAFFAAVRERVERGADPAVALRDERLRRLTGSHDDAWMSGLVVFESLTTASM